MAKRKSIPSEEEGSKPLKKRRTINVVSADGFTDGSDASDESADDAARRDRSVPLSWNRPNGRDELKYPDWRKWSKQRWAWEFLRRNADFQRECQNGWDNESHTPWEFHLRKFKDYRQEYGDGEKPKFASIIRSFPTRETFSERAEHAQVDDKAVELAEIRTRLYPTEVLISFQIEPLLLAEETALRKQLAEAESRLKSFAAKLRSLRQRDERPLRVEDFDRHRLFAALRMLDWQHGAQKSSVIEAALHLHPFVEREHATRSDPADKEISNWGSSLRKFADGLVKGGYLTIRFGNVVDRESKAKRKKEAARSR